MKKYLSIILAFCLCIFAVPFLSGCDEEENKYWLETNTKYETFVNEVLPDYVNGFTFNEKIQTNIDNSYASFDELQSIYTPVFKVSIGFLEKYKNSFGMEPFKKTGEVEKAYAELISDIDTLSASLKNFKEVDIPTFEEGVKGSTQEDAEHSTSRQYLKEFKRKYIDLSTEVLSFAEKVLNLYVTAYQDIPSLYDGKQYKQLTPGEIQNYSRLALSKTIIYSLLPAIDYINSFNGTYIQYQHDYYIEIINSYADLIEQNKTTTATSESLYAFTYTFEAYENDVELFKQALESIDMPLLSGEDYNFDAFEYAKGDHNSQNYANAIKVLRFSENSMYILKDKLLALYI